MKLGLVLPYDGSIALTEALALVERAEALGFDSAWVPEAWGTDAVSILGALAVRTSRIRLGSGIVNIFSRSPALLAQTAATLDLLSRGRFILGLGTSGHQVIAGWHGVPFERPIQRLRETTEIVRTVLRREPLRFQGEIFRLDQGLKLRARPLRSAIPIFLATLTPPGLRLTGELADGWMPTLFSPAHADLFRADLAAGARRSGRMIDTIEIAPFFAVAVDDDRDRAREAVRSFIAFYVGGMGSRQRNFYNDTVRRYGFEAEAQRIQALYLEGKRAEAVAGVPDALVDAVTLAGPPPVIREGLQACAAAGVTTALAQLHATDPSARLDALEALARAAA